jgi:hypothetical protein
MNKRFSLFNNDKPYLLELLNILVVGIMVVIGTFPENLWTYSTGIDPPLSWAFNYLYDNDLKLGQHIIFPHGPLAFLMYPLPENILIATLVRSVFKILLVYNLYWIIAGTYKEVRWLLVFIVAFGLSIITGFNHLLLANVILMYCNSYLHKKDVFKYMALTLTALAFYVKAYVAILSGILSLSYILFNFFKSRNLKTIAIDSLVLLATIVLLWLSMYGNLVGFINYIWGMLQLAQDNSSAAAYYPHNNWLVLGLFFFTISIIVLINRTKKFSFFLALIGISVFAAWKHGMARQDIYHVKGFLIYIVTCLLILVLFIRRNNFQNTVLSLLAIFLLSISMKGSVNYFRSKYELFRAQNFIEFVTEFPTLKNRSISVSQREIHKNKLPIAFIDSIGKATVDIYPWDYSFISANNLNWQPRVVINSYAAYTSWLDSQNEKHFNSALAPEILIVEKFKKRNLNGGTISSIDGRYLLNDEPKTITSIIENYEYWFSNERVQILKRRKEPISLLSEIITSQEATWGEWIQVPKSEGEILRVRLQLKKSFLQKLKAFFYKDEQFWIYLKLENDIIHKYRIVPKNAADGIWITPYFFDNSNVKSVKEIMIKASNQSILKDRIVLEWDGIESSEKGVVEKLYTDMQAKPGTILFSSINKFEQPEVTYWGELKNEHRSDNAMNGNYSHSVKAKSYSHTLSIPIDSLTDKPFTISAGCWVNASNYKLSKDILLVISIDDKEGNVLWKGKHIDSQIIEKKGWNHVLNYSDYKNEKPDCVLKVYVWNNSDEEVLIDDFRVLVKAKATSSMNSGF